VFYAPSLILRQVSHVLELRVVSSKPLGSQLPRRPKASQESETSKKTFFSIKLRDCWFTLYIKLPNSVTVYVVHFIQNPVCNIAKPEFFKINDFFEIIS
jgi:hypothetical protein